MIVDFHTHVLPDEFQAERERWIERDATFRALFSDPAAKTSSSAQLVAEMDGAGIDVSVALGYGWTDPDAARLGNDYALDAAAGNPGRIVPFCSVDPAWGPEALSEVERCVAAGARGIGELHSDTQGFELTDPDRLRPLMALAEEAALPVLVHGSEPLGHAYPGKGTATPEKLLALAAAFPGVAFVFAHFGGGLPFYALMPEVAESLSNVYFDSASAPLLYRQDAYSVVVATAGSGRVLFGSDYPLLRQGRALREARDSGLTDVELASVLGANAGSLLGLSEAG